MSIPVIAVGRINSPEVAEEILARGDADFVATGRALIADPYWPRKAREGRPEDIRKCVACNMGCIGRLMQQNDVKCTQNPWVGTEFEAGLPPAALKKHVLVLGGGPAGLEAARVAASPRTSSHAAGEVRSPRWPDTTRNVFRREKLNCRK